MSRAIGGSGNRSSTTSRDLPQAIQVLLHAAEDLGMNAEFLDPAYNYLLRLRWEGRARLFLGGRSPLNHAVAARLAEDKHYTEVLLRERGFKTPLSVRCLSPGAFQTEGYPTGLEPGLEFAGAQGFPLVVKPNRLSHGRGIRVVSTMEQVAPAVEAVWAMDSIALVQTYAAGGDFRLNFLDGEFLAGYERRSLELVGDGHRTIRALAMERDERAAHDGTWRSVTASDSWSVLTRDRGWNEDTIPDAGDRFELGAGILNLSHLVTARVIESIPEPWLRFGREVAAAMELRHLGIDLRASSLDRDPMDATVIEVNASPLLSHLYKIGHRAAAVAAQKRVLMAVFEVTRT